MAKYKVFDISGQEDLIAKHSVFLRQLHRLGIESNVFFHLLYFYDGAEGISKGKRLQIIFYATADSPRKLELIREFVTTSVLSTYYDFYCYEISTAMDYRLDEGYLQFTNLSGTRKKYKLSGSINHFEYDAIKKQIESDGYLYCSIEPNTNEVTEINSQLFYLDSIGRIGCDYSFDHASFLTKKDYHLYAQNRLYNDPQNSLIPIYSIMEWIPNPLGRLFNVLKLMEGYNETCALRIDLFPVDVAESFNDNMAPTINELRQRMSQHEQGKDDNCDTVLKSIEGITKKLMKYPQFFANVIAFADHKDISVMLVDSVGAEAVESGSYLVKDISTFGVADKQYEIYSYDSEIVIDRTTYSLDGNYMSEYVSLYTLDEVRPMFSFPVLYPGESIECAKETDPEFEEENENTLHLGISDNGYSVNFPIKLLNKHAFIAGVPGSGKTNTMLYMVSELWNTYHIPFLVLEPAKQEYRALAKTSKLKGMDALKEICYFSPSADSRFPLHINPFEFPIGLTLAEHISNLNSVFSGAFELPPPSPHFIDTCIEQIYLNKGWNINSRNDGSLPYPTMQELYDSLNVAVQNSHYEGETLGNLRSVMEVRVGSLLKREIGNVYNVEFSSFKPEEWLERPVIIELESLGEGPANFMTLLISTLIRETLKINKIKDRSTSDNGLPRIGLNHIIFYEEAHNLIGQTQENIGDRVDPKVSATKFLIKMLAEVRALDEGIVIADQLPSVMAPEVLKNTGLKIGHRITANDDRELLGGTMSASPDQLAEQSVFLPGEALVFYEGIQKPFKMSIAKWQRTPDEYCDSATDELIAYLKNDYYLDNEDSSEQELIEDYFLNIYDSPTDIELYRIIKDYPTYKELLLRSKEIVIQRVIASFSSYYYQLNEINRRNLIPAYAEGDKWLREIQLYKKNYSKSKNRKEELAKIVKMESQYTDFKSVFTELLTYKGDKPIPIKRKLIFMLNECNILFANNISIVKNYDALGIELSATIIDAYLLLFESIDYRHLWKNNDLVDAVLTNTAAVRNVIKTFVDYSCAEPSGALANTEYYSLLKEHSYAIRCFGILNDFNLLNKQLIDALDWKSQTFDCDVVKTIAEEYSKKYFEWMAVSNEYQNNREEMQSLIILKYSELFDCIKYFRDPELIAHQLYVPTREVYSNVTDFGSSNGSSITPYTDKLEDEITSLKRHLIRIEIYEVYYTQAKRTLRDLIKEIDCHYATITRTQLETVVRAYIKTYFDCLSICKNAKMRGLVTCIDELFCTIISELGVKLNEEQKRYLNMEIGDYIQKILECEEKHNSNNADDIWQIVDKYWAH